VLVTLAVGLVDACSDSQPASHRMGRDLQRAAAGSAELIWSEPIDVAAGPAVRGRWRMNNSEFRYVDDPSVAIDTRGRIVVVWANQVDQDVVLQAYDPAGAAIFDVPVNVSRSPDVFSWFPRVSIPAAEPGRVYVVWQELVFSGGSHGGEIFFVRSADGGRTFDTPVNLSRTSAGAGKGRLSADLWHNGSLDLVVGDGGDIHVAWSEYEGALRYRRSTDGGVTFGRTVHVAGDATAPTRGPTLALERDGAVHLAWTFGEDPAADVHLATSSDGGRTFGAPSVVADSGGHADAPKLVVAGDGTLPLPTPRRRKSPRAAAPFSTCVGRSARTPSRPRGHFPSAGRGTLTMSGSRPWLSMTTTASTSCGSGSRPAGTGRSVSVSRIRATVGNLRAANARARHCGSHTRHQRRPSGLADAEARRGRRRKHRGRQQQLR